MVKKHVISMPTLLLLMLAAAISTVLFGGTRDSHAQSAYDYPFCGFYQDRSGATSCYFSSYAQCMATMRGGNMGYCKQNPFYRGPNMIEPPRRKARRY